MWHWATLHPWLFFFLVLAALVVLGVSIDNFFNFLAFRRNPTAYTEYKRVLEMERQRKEREEDSNSIVF